MSFSQLLILPAMGCKSWIQSLANLVCPPNLKFVVCHNFQIYPTIRMNIILNLTFVLWILRVVLGLWICHWILSKMQRGRISVIAEISPMQNVWLSNSLFTFIVCLEICFFAFGWLIENKLAQIPSFCRKETSRSASFCQKCNCYWGKNAYLC